MASLSSLFPIRRNQVTKLAFEIRRVVALLSFPFLPINADVADASAVFHHELFRLHEHPARTVARVIDAAFVRREHFDNQLHHTTGRS